MLATNEAAPAASCWIEELKLITLPRRRGSAPEVINAIAGTMRAEDAANMSIETSTATKSGERGRLVIASAAMPVAMAATAKVARRPTLSLQPPTRRAVSSAATPATRYTTGSCASLTPTFVTRYGAMNGNTRNPENTSSAENAKIRRWLASPNTALSCASALRSPPAARCARTGGIANQAASRIAEQSAARNTQGARQVKCSARYRLIGTPRIDASEKADMTAPKARPRRLSGTTSATRVEMFAATTPPKAPAAVRAASRSEERRVGKEGRARGATDDD